MKVEVYNMLVGAQGQTGEPVAEGLEVLAGKQRRGHDHGDLQPLHGGNERRTQRHLRLAEPHIAADQAIHGPAGAQIVDHGINGSGYNILTPCTN